MFKTIANAWRIPELRKKILYTLMILLIFRIGTFICIPGVDINAVKSAVEGGGFFGFIDLFTGGGLKNFSFFALGISPYITASIVMQLLQVAIKPLEKLMKEGGEEGRKKVATITRYATVGLSIVQAIGMIIMLQSKNALLDNSMLTYAVIIITLTAGGMLTMWLGERITEKGVGSGISLIIFVGIVARLIPSAIELIQSVIEGQTNFWVAIIIFLFALALIAVVVFVDLGQRRVPVQYAKRVVGRKMYGGQSTHIPIRVNASGVLPIIFAMVLLQFPVMIANLFPKSDASLWMSQNLISGTWLHLALYAVLIFGFTYFYAAVQFNPIDVAKNLQQYGGFVPGIRPGKPTSDYLQKINSRITFFGAVFLALIAAIPILFAIVSGGAQQLAFSATGLLIMVSVALETNKQLEAQMLMRHYKGFLK
ncbi:MAG: preprotein translocase subunit SecY [Bacillota bacterium]|nr:preprotein translocase subunit SecY [Bacillota bacterium]